MKTNRLNASPVMAMPSRPVQAHEICRVKQIVTVVRDFPGRAVRRVNEYNSAYGSHQEQDERIDRIDPILDPPGGAPASQRV